MSDLLQMTLSLPPCQSETVERQLRVRIGSEESLHSLPPESRQYVVAAESGTICSVELKDFDAAGLSSADYKYHWVAGRNVLREPSDQAVTVSDCD